MQRVKEVYPGREKSVSHSFLHLAFSHSFLTLQQYIAAYHSVLPKGLQLASNSGNGRIDTGEYDVTNHIVYSPTPAKNSKSADHQK